jgi:hypothetical protein
VPGALPKGDLLVMFAGLNDDKRFKLDVNISFESSVRSKGAEDLCKPPFENGSIFGHDGSMIEIRFSAKDLRKAA